jgi:hypothetical protein
VGIVPNAGAELPFTQVMNVSVRPWSADRQPSRAEAEVMAVRGRYGTRTAFGTFAPADRIRPRAVGTFSRRHIDLLRVAGALCPAYVNALARHTP